MTNEANDRSYPAYPNGYMGVNFDWVGINPETKEPIYRYTPETVEKLLQTPLDKLYSELYSRCAITAAD